MATVRSRDDCVVDTEPLSTLLRGFVVDWNHRHPQTSGKFSGGTARTEVTMVGAIAWITQETKRRDPAGVGVPHGTVARVAAGRSRTTELRVADPIVTAINRPEALYDGTLSIRPRSAHASCCSGSSRPFRPWSLTG